MVSVWDAETMEPLAEYRVRDPVLAIAVSKSGDHLFTASSYKIHAWRRQKARHRHQDREAALAHFKPTWAKKQSAGVLSLLCTDDAKRFFTGHQDGSIRSWVLDKASPSADGKYALLLVLAGHTGMPVHDLLMYDGFVLSGGGDKKIKMWKPRSVECLQSTVLGASVYCLCHFRPALDMAKFKEKDLVTQLLAGGDDGTLGAFPLQSNSAFLYTRMWTCSAKVQVFPQSGLSFGAGSAAEIPSASITSVACPTRYGDAWEFVFVGTSIGAIKVFELLWADPKKQAVSKLSPLFTHLLHSGPISCLIPAGGWLFSASHDTTIIPFGQPKRGALHEGGGFSQAALRGYCDHAGSITAVAATDNLLFSVDDEGVVLVRQSRRANELKSIDADGARSIIQLSKKAAETMDGSLQHLALARSTIKAAIIEFSGFSDPEFTDAIVPDILIDTADAHVLAATPRPVEEILASKTPQPDDVWSFLGAVVGHFYARRSVTVEISDAERGEMRRIEERCNKLHATAANVLYLHQNATAAFLPDEAKPAAFDEATGAKQIAEGETNDEASETAGDEVRGDVAARRREWLDDDAIGGLEPPRQSTVDAASVGTASGHEEAKASTGSAPKSSAADSCSATGEDDEEDPSEVLKPALIVGNEASRYPHESRLENNACESANATESESESESESEGESEGESESEGETAIETESESESESERRGRLGSSEDGDGKSEGRSTHDGESLALSIAMRGQQPAARSKRDQDFEADRQRRERSRKLLLAEWMRSQEPEAGASPGDTKSPLVETPAGTSSVRS